MKTILMTTFAIAVVVFAFNVTPSYAGEDDLENIKCSFADCSNPADPTFPSLTEVNDPDQADNERDIADSGDEGSTSAASGDGISANQDVDRDRTIEREDTGSITGGRQDEVGN